MRRPFLTMTPDSSVLADDVEVYPVFWSLCMGWSWSLFFANESVNFTAHGMIERPLQQIRDKAPVLSIEEQPIIGYICSAL